MGKLRSSRSFKNVLKRLVPHPASYALSGSTVRNWSKRGIQLDVDDFDDDFDWENFTPPKCPYDARLNVPVVGGQALLLPEYENMDVLQAAMYLMHMECPNIEIECEFPEDIALIYIFECLLHKNGRCIILCQEERDCDGLRDAVRRIGAPLIGWDYVATASASTTVLVATFDQVEDEMPLPPPPELPGASRSSKRETSGKRPTPIRAFAANERCFLLAYGQGGQVDPCLWITVAYVIEKPRQVLAVNSGRLPLCPKISVRTVPKRLRKPKAHCLRELAMSFFQVFGFFKALLFSVVGCSCLLLSWIWWSAVSSLGRYADFPCIQDEIACKDARIRELDATVLCLKQQLERQSSDLMVSEKKVVCLEKKLEQKEKSTDPWHLGPDPWASAGDRDVRDAWSKVSAATQDLNTKNTKNAKNLVCAFWFLRTQELTACLPHLRIFDSSDHTAMAAELKRIISVLHEHHAVCMSSIRNRRKLSSYPWKLPVDEKKQLNAYFYNNPQKAWLEFQQTLEEGFENLRRNNFFWNRDSKKRMLEEVFQLCDWGDNAFSARIATAIAKIHKELVPDSPNLPLLRGLVAQVAKFILCYRNENGIKGDSKRAQEVVLPWQDPVPQMAVHLRRQKPNPFAGPILLNEVELEKMKELSNKRPPQAPPQAPPEEGKPGEHSVEEACH